MGQKLPPGPRTPSLFQGAGMWTRPISWLERNRAKYGNRFTTRFPFTPPFVVIADPEQVKEIFTAPPDVLMPGVGARVLLPLVGPSLGAPPRRRRAHVAAKADAARVPRRADGAPDRPRRQRDRRTRSRAWSDGEMELHPRFQSLTLEIILRAVFGLEPGPRLDALRESLSKLLAYGDNPLTLLPPPEEPARLELTERFFNAVRPDQGLRRPPRRGRRAPRRRDRRAALRRRRGFRRRPLDAPRRPPRGRLADERYRAPRRAHDPARRRARDDRLLAGVDACHAWPASRASWPSFAARWTPRTAART